MADDSDEVIKPKVFEASAPPHGMPGYDLAALTGEQQTLLNSLKTNTAREDWMYLARHPQVHAVVALLLRGYFRDHPRNVPQYAATFVQRAEFRDEVDDYLLRHPFPPPPPGPYTKGASSGEVSEEAEEIETVVVYEDEREAAELNQWIKDLIFSSFKKYTGGDSEIFGKSLDKFHRPEPSVDAFPSLDVIGLRSSKKGDEIMKRRLQRISEYVDVSENKEASPSEM